MVGFGRPWFLCGGWAVDAWLGQPTRYHWDVDIAVCHEDQRAIFDHLPGWTLVAHDPNVPDDTTEPWDGRHLDLPAHVHVHGTFELEFLLNERAGDDLVLHEERGVTVPLDRCTRPSAWGLPTAPPEVVLFYKGDGDIRPQDEQDFLALLPTLDVAQRTWLRDALVPGHPWLPHLRGRIAP